MLLNQRCLYGGEQSNGLSAQTVRLGHWPFGGERRHRAQESRLRLVGRGGYVILPDSKQVVHLMAAMN